MVLEVSCANLYCDTDKWNFFHTLRLHYAALPYYTMNTGQAMPVTRQLAT